MRLFSRVNREVGCRGVASPSMLRRVFVAAMREGERDRDTHRERGRERAAALAGFSSFPQQKDMEPADMSPSPLLQTRSVLAAANPPEYL